MTPQTQTHKKNINRVYKIADKHTRVRLGFLVKTKTLLTLEWFPSV